MSNTIWIYKQDRRKTRIVETVKLLMGNRVTDQQLPGGYTLKDISQFLYHCPKSWKVYRWEHSLGNFKRETEQSGFKPSPKAMNHHPHPPPRGHYYLSSPRGIGNADKNIPWGTLRERPNKTDLNPPPRPCTIVRGSPSEALTYPLPLKVRNGHVLTAPFIF